MRQSSRALDRFPEDPPGAVRANRLCAGRLISGSGRAIGNILVLLSKALVLVDLVIFDCDGVLIDSEPIACAADAEALSAIGYKITCDEVVERFAGMPSEAMYAILEREFGRPLPVDFDTRVKRVVFEKYRSELCAIAGVSEVLASLEPRKCVASSSSPAKLALGLLETDLFELLYPNIFSTALVARGKPYPDLFEYAARAMGADASACLVVEDSVAGVTAATRAGMRSIGFTGGSHCRPGHGQKLIDAGAAVVIGDLRELFDLVD